MTRGKYQSMLAETWKPEKKGDSIEGEIFILDTKKLKEDPVPYVELINGDGEPTQVLLGNFALQKVYFNPLVVEGGYLGIRYDGESTTIKNAGNFAKLFSVFYYKPGDWHMNEAGEVEGKLCVLNAPSTRRLERLSAIPDSMGNLPIDQYPQSNEPFNPEEPEDHPKRPKAKK